MIVAAVAISGTASAAVDLWTRRVPNRLTLGIAACGVALAAGHFSSLSVGHALAGLVVGLLLMLPGFRTASGSFQRTQWWTLYGATE